MWLSRYFNREEPPRQSNEYFALTGSPELAAGDSPDEDEIVAENGKDSPGSLSDWFEPSSYTVRAASRVLKLLYTLLTLSTLTIAVLAFLLMARATRFPAPEQTQVMLRSIEDNGAGLGSVLQQLQRTVM